MRGSNLRYAREPGHIHVDQLVEVISGDVLQGYEIHTYWRCWREY